LKSITAFHLSTVTQKARRLRLSDIKSRQPDLEEALDNLQIVSMRFGKRNAHQIERILLFIEDSILIQASHSTDNDLEELEEELVEYTQWLEDRFKQHEDEKTYEDIVSNIKREQVHCRTLRDTSDGGSMIAWVLNKGEDQGVSVSSLSSNNFLIFD